MTEYDEKTVHVTDYYSIRRGVPRHTDEYWRRPPRRGRRYH